jgi:hypothetical protein
MSSDLEVLPIKQYDYPNEIDWVNKILPDINRGSICIHVGSVKSGKSVTASNIFLNPSFFGDKKGRKPAFDKVYYWSSTAKNDVTSRFMLKKYEDTFFESYDDETLRGIIRQQESYDKRDQPRIALYFDDMQGQGKGGTGLMDRGSYFVSLCSRFRHYNIKYIHINIQNFRLCNPVVRANASEVLVSGTNNLLEIKKLNEELSARFPNFLELLKEATQKPYGFLYLRLMETPAKAYQNFTRLLYESPSNSNFDIEEVKKITDN